MTQIFKICPNCGSKVEHNAVFCTNCGYEFNTQNIQKANTQNDDSKPNDNKSLSTNKYQLGLNYYHNTNYQKAITEFNKAIELDNNNVLAMSYLADSYENLEDYTNTIKILKHAIQISPNNNIIYNKLGVAYSRINDNNKAIKYCQKAANIKPEPLYYTNIAGDYYNQNNKQQAIKYYKKAITLDPNNVNNYDWLSFLYMSINNQLAYKYCQKAISLDNTNQKYYNRLGYINENLHHFKDASKDFQQAIKLSQNSNQLNDNKKCLSQCKQLLQKYNTVGNNNKYYSKQLDDLINLNHTAKQIKRYISQYKYDKEESYKNKKNTHGIIHLLFEGNMGTGKLTVAKLFFNILKHEKIIKDGHFVTTNASLVAPNTLPNLISTSMNGVLVIDNIYSYFNSDKKNQENIPAIDSFLSAAEKYKNNIVIICCGQANKINNLLRHNPRFKSQFPDIIHFNDYTVSDCQRIFIRFMRQGHLHIDSEATKNTLLDNLRRFIELKKANHLSQYANAITVRNIYYELRTDFITDLQNRYTPEQLKELKKAHNNKLNTINITNVNFTFNRLIPKQSNKNTSTNVSAIDKLNNLIGLDNVKQQIKEYINNAKINKITNNHQQPEMHLIFEGNPGTGKTTVARLFARALYEGHVIPTYKLVEVQGTDFASKYAGGPRAKMDQVIQQAMGGVLFIDEAYSLGKSYNTSSNNEAIATLVAAAENHQHDLVIIMAGYTNPMENFLNHTNPGLVSRFPTKIIFHDYTGEQCFKILKHMMNAKHLKLSETPNNINNILCQYIKKSVSLRQGLSQNTFGNARYIRSILQKLILTKNDRLSKLPTNKLHTLELNNSSDIYTITLNDIKNTFNGIGISRQQSHSALDKLNNLIGLGNVKSIMKKYIANAKVEKILHINTQSEMHMVFEGNPGTGKTTVARLFAEALYEGKVIKSYKVKEVQGSDLMAGYVGQTKDRTRRIIHDAIGGVLFIDEAYTLGGTPGESNSFAQEAIAELIADIEKYRDDLVVILAGYTKPMEKFLQNTNPGLSSRFSTRINFPDYNNQECVDILLYMMKSHHIFLSDENNIEDILRLDVINSINKRHNIEGTRFGNARDVRHILQKIVFAKNARLAKNSISNLMELNKEDSKALRTVKLIDLRHVFKN